MEWRKSLNNIKDEQLSFTLTLKTLLLPLVEDEDLDETDLETLLADPRCERWKEADIDEALQSRLGSAHVRFFEIVSELQSLIWQLLTIVGIDRPRLRARVGAPLERQVDDKDKPRNRLIAAALRELTKTSFEYRKEQLKFGFGESQRQDLLKDIRSNNKKLDKLLEKSDKIASFKTAKTVAVSPKAIKSLL
ncbi:hypothetical protein LTR36_004378 [Oleoguttula mirabilis]|uniref:Uncharacterized protein n=1 Tax=Oleoguttula mirabilis TaxID=1507867 RepID=A0AAV9JFY6_9PEZI|nr:hypothetical protein LTR36_004378 [Oleoguttula mirabilis]